MKSVRDAAAEFFCTLPCNPRNAEKTLQRLNFTIAEAAEIIACFTHKNPNGKLMVSHATIDSLERVMRSSIEKSYA